LLQSSPAKTLIGGAPAPASVGAWPVSGETALALAIVLGFALARIAFALSLDFGVDEAYTVAIARRLDWSYFDHPPLHQWLAHFAALALGEGPAARLPFVALFAATGWLMFALTRDLFGGRAGLWATFALNATPFFFASAGAWIVPDGMLLFALAATAYALARLLFAKETAVWPLWLAAGFFLGLAGLSKYNAVFFALGIFIFLAISPSRRHWFAHPAPYCAALIALAMISPVIVWNADNAWASFFFQGARGAVSERWRPSQIGAMAFGEIAFLSPWIFAILIGGLVAAMRRIREGDDDGRRLFLLCLALPPIVIFTLTPLWGARGLPHWPMPGWFFAYPLLGAWLAEASPVGFARRAWAIGSAAGLALIAVTAVAEARTGFLTRLIPSLAAGADPTLETLNWSGLRQSPLLNAETNDAPFVVATKWTEAGKIAEALGPATPVTVFSNDPHGFAFLADPASFVGRDAVIVVARKRLDETLAALAPYFEHLGEPQSLALGRDGTDEVDLALVPAKRLLRAYPLPYPRRAASTRQVESAS
jgi:hypothetical protein